MTAMAPNPHATPMPAAVPVLRLEELLAGDCEAGDVAPVEVDEEEDDVETVLVAVVPTEVEDVVAIVPVLTVAVLNSSRLRGTVSPSVASGWLSHADFMALRTVTKGMSWESASGLQSLPVITYSFPVLPSLFPPADKLHIGQRIEGTRCYLSSSTHIALQHSGRTTRWRGPDIDLHSRLRSEVTMECCH